MTPARFSLTVVCADTHKGAAVETLKALKSRCLPATALCLGPHWASSVSRLAGRLALANHLLVIVSADEGGWFPFIAGYCAGHARTSYILAACGNDPPELALSGCRIVGSVTEAVSLLLEARMSWERTRLQLDARESLIGQGFGITSETLAERVAAGDEKAVSAFLTLDFDPKTVNAKGVSLLALAVRFRHPRIVELLLERGANVNMASADRGNTALMDAAVQGETGIMASLLDAGADPDVRSKNGQTALMLAIGEGRTEAVRLLLLRGADTEAVDALGMNARRYAALFRHEDIIGLLDADTTMEVRGEH